MKYQVSTADRLRISIALTVLRFKPKDASIPSYVADLRSKFSPSSLTLPTVDYAWKLYALKLEHDYEQLKTQYEAQKTELLAKTDKSVPDISSKAALSNEQTNLNTVPGKEKAKAKKKPGSDVTISAKPTPHSNIQGVSQGLHPLHDQHIGIPPNGDLLIALQAFETAVREKNGSTLLRATLHVLRVASRLIESVLDSRAAHMTNKVSLSTLGTVLHHVIVCSLSSMTAYKAPLSATELQLTEVDIVFDCLIDSVFGPIIQAFKQLSEALLLGEIGVFPTPKRRLQDDTVKKIPCDIDLRPDLLRLFQALVGSLASAQKSIIDNYRDDQTYRWLVSFSTLKASLALEAIHELRRVLFLIPTEGLRPKDSGTDPQCHDRNVGSKTLRSAVPGSVDFNSRVKRLTAKDTLCYLCSLMHILASLSTFEGLKPPSWNMPVASPTDAGSYAKDRTASEFGLLGLLHDAILSALYELVLKCRSTASQLEKDHGQSKGGDENCPIRDQPDNDCHFEPGDQYPNATPDSQPRLRENKVDAPKAEVYSANDVADKLWGSRSQGRVYGPNDKESEVGDPGGRVRPTLSDIITTSALTGGADHGTDSPTYDAAYQGKPSEVTNLTTRFLPAPQPELGTPASRLGEPSLECLIDEAGFGVLLGVVERYILDPEYTR